MADRVLVRVPAGALRWGALLPEGGVIQPDYVTTEQQARELVERWPGSRLVRRIETEWEETPW